MAKKRKRRQTSRIEVDTIEARCIVLKDEFGQKRVGVSCSGDGNHSYAGFSMLDDTGRPRLTLQVGDCGNPSIRLEMPEGHSGISMAVNHGRGNGLSISDHDGKPCIMLGVPGPKSEDPRGSHPRIDVMDWQDNRAWAVFEGNYSVQSASGSTNATSSPQEPTGEPVADADNPQENERD